MGKKSKKPTGNEVETTETNKAEAIPTQSTDKIIILCSSLMVIAWDYLAGKLSTSISSNTQDKRDQLIIPAIVVVILCQIAKEYTKPRDHNQNLMLLEKEVPDGAKTVKQPTHTPEATAMDCLVVPTIKTFMHLMDNFKLHTITGQHNKQKEYVIRLALCCYIALLCTPKIKMALTGFHYEENKELQQVKHRGSKKEPKQKTTRNKTQNAKKAILNTYQD